MSHYFSEPDCNQNSVCSVQVKQVELNLLVPLTSLCVGTTFRHDWIPVVSQNSPYPSTIRLLCWLGKLHFSLYQHNDLQLLCNARLNCLRRNALDHCLPKVVSVTFRHDCISFTRKARFVCSSSLRDFLSVLLNKF